MSDYWQQCNTYLKSHKKWRTNCLNLIASENVTGSKVQAMLSEELSHRYGDYVGIDLRARKYLGNRFIVKIEEIAHTLAKKLFGSTYVDLRPLSGHMAGNAGIMTFCRPGDIVMEIGSDGGGHRLAEKLCASPLVQLKVEKISFLDDPYNVDLPATLEKIGKLRPKLVILGSSCFLFPHPISQIRMALEQLPGKAYLMYDASHVAGLIAGKRFQSPLVEGADLVCSSTHKTMGGPQGGMILTNSREIAEEIGKVIYPALVTNHHLNRLLACAANFCELLRWGEEYATKITHNAKTLAAALDIKGLSIIGKASGYTESHTVLLNTSKFGEAREIAKRLEEHNIICGSVRLPSRDNGYGLRVGVQEVTRLGMGNREMEKIADWMVRIFTRKRLRSVRSEITAFKKQFTKSIYAL